MAEVEVNVSWELNKRSWIILRSHFSRDGSEAEKFRQKSSAP